MSLAAAVSFGIQCSVFGILLAAIIKFRLSFGAAFDLEELDSSLMYANYTPSTPIYPQISDPMGAPSRTNLSIRRH